MPRFRDINPGSELFRDTSVFASFWINNVKTFESSHHGRQYDLPV